VTDPDDSLRVSDAERDQTLRVLGDHAAVGRLTLEELEERRGRFRAADRINAVSVLGSEEIDLREAELEGGELTLSVFTFMGEATIYVPDSVELDVGGFSLMGEHTEIGADRPPRPGAPVVRLRTWNLMGHATVYRVPPQARGLGLKEARRLAKAASRGELPAPG